MFFGVVVEANSPKILAATKLRILQVALKGGAKTNESTRVYVEVFEAKYLLCSLTEINPQAGVEISIEKKSEFKFIVEGAGEVHITGFCATGQEKLNIGEKVTPTNIISSSATFTISPIPKVSKELLYLDPAEEDSIFLINKANRSWKKPPIGKVPASKVLSQVQQFLPKIQAANAQLAKKIAQGEEQQVNLEHIEDENSPFIEMNLSLGVLEEQSAKEEPKKPLIEMI